MPRRTALPDGWLTATDAAHLLGVTRQRVHQLIQADALEAVRMGRFWLVSRAAVESRKLGLDSRKGG